MAKALFLSLPLHGHTNPSLPLVRELVARGEAIVYFSSDRFGPQVEQAGARCRSYRNAFLKDITHLPERVHQLSSLLMRTTAEVLEHELEIFRAERPDYIICDSVAPWGPCVAELLKVPVITSISTFAFNRQVLAFGVSRGVRPKSVRVLLSKILHLTKAVLIRRRIRRSYGVGPDLMRLIFGCTDLNIVYTSRYFQPCAETFDERFHFVGPLISPRSEAIPFPWEAVRHPLVIYVSLGTLFNREPAFFRNCLEAFGSLDAHCILSIGTNVSAESLHPLPGNCTVRPYVPQLEVLERATVFVTHGGMNSVSESLLHGVPVLVIPQMGEQAIVGRQVEALGAGLYLAKDEASAENLAAAVQRLLTDKQFRERAVAVRDSFQSAGGAERAADAILVFSRAAE